MIRSALFLMIASSTSGIGSEIEPGWTTLNYVLIDCLAVLTMRPNWIVVLKDRHCHICASMQNDHHIPKHVWPTIQPKCLLADLIKRRVEPRCHQVAENVTAYHYPTITKNKELTMW